MKRGAVLAVAALTACTQATGELRGGATLDTTPPPPPRSICFDEDAGPGGARWSELHRDFFGPTAYSRCAGNGACHGDAEQAGARSSGFTCGEDARACRASFIESNWVEPGSPNESPILTALRRYDVDGGVIAGVNMPKVPACAFSVASMERIRTWIQNGAPDD